MLCLALEIVPVRTARSLLLCKWSFRSPNRGALLRCTYPILMATYIYASGKPSYESRHRWLANFACQTVNIGSFAYKQSRITVGTKYVYDTIALIFRKKESNSPIL